MLRLLGRVVDVEREELPALGWTWLYFYAVLASYYVIRPIRDEAGVAGGVDNLPWLWTGTLVAVSISNPAFAALVARFPRVKFVSWSYRFFALNLIAFFFLLHSFTGAENIWVGRVFYVWTAVFNLFVPSVFWAFMTDIFTRDQAKRLFGIISAAGTLGAMTGSILTATLAEHIPPIYLLFFSAALIELSVVAVRRLARLTERLREVRAASSNEQIFQAVRRAGNFAVARPTREVLFTVLPREDRYKTKNFIDTFVYRLGDQIGAWSQAALGAAGMGLVGMAWLAVPVAILWLVNGMWLGRRQEKLAAAASSPAPVAASTPASDAFVAARS